MGSNAKTDVASAAYATPRVGTRLLLATNFKLFLSSTPQLQDQPTCQDGRVPDQAELPRGLRGVDQQADQHGILCLLRLSLHELLLQPRRPSPPWFRGSLQEGVERGARPRHEVDGVPDQKGRPRCLPGHRQADHDGLGPRWKPWRPRSSLRRRSTRASSTSTRWPGTRATVTCAISSSPST